MKEMTEARQDIGNKKEMWDESETRRKRKR